MSNTDLPVTPNDLEDWARKDLVLRCLQHRTKPTRKNPKGIRSTIILGWSINQSEGSRSDLCEIKYEFTSPSKKPRNSLTFTQLGSDPEAWFDHFAKLISEWEESTKGWLISEPSVAIRRGATAEKKVPFSSFGLFEHYCYLRQILSQRMRRKSSAQEDLILVHDRLEIIIDSILEDWDKLLEQMHV